MGNEPARHGGRECLHLDTEVGFRLLLDASVLFGEGSGLHMCWEWKLFGVVSGDFNAGVSATSFVQAVCPYKLFRSCSQPHTVLQTTS